MPAGAFDNAVQLSVGKAEVIDHVSVTLPDLAIVLDDNAAHAPLAPVSRTQIRSKNFLIVF